MSPESDEEEGDYFFLILKTKADGNGGQTIENLGPLTKKRMETIDDETVAAAIKKHPAAFPQIHATSSDKGLGIPELRAEIAGLL